MYYLLTSLDIKSKNAKFISSILYVINPVSMIFLITPPIAIGVALMPLVLGFLINGITKKSRIYFILIIIVSFISSYTAVNPAVFAAIWFPFIFYVVLNFSKIKKSHLFLLFSGILLVNIYWILNIISIAKDVGFEHSMSWTTWTTANSSFLNMFRFQGFWAWNAKAFGSYLFPQKVFYENPVIIFISFCITSFAFLIFLNIKGLSRAKRSNLYVITLLFLISMFIAKGLHEPLSFLNKFAYKNIPFFWIFRSPWEKFIPVVVFSLIILFCYSSEFIEERFLIGGNRHEKTDLKLRLFKVIPFLLIFVFGGPYFTGAGLPVDRGNFPGGRVEIPDYWYKAAEVINNQIGGGRILLLPENPFYQMHYFWPKDGYYGTDPTAFFIFKPLISISPGGGFMKNTSSEFLKVLYEKIANGEGSDLIPYLRMANVKYVLHRNDLDWTHLGENKNDALSEPKRIEKTIKKLPVHSKKSFGVIRVENNKLDQYFEQVIVKKYPYMANREALSLYELDDKYFLPQIYSTYNSIFINGSTSDMFQVFASDRYETGEPVYFLSSGNLNQKKMKFILGKSNEKLVTNTPLIVKSKDKKYATDNYAVPESGKYEILIKSKEELKNKSLKIEVDKKFIKPTFVSKPDNWVSVGYYNFKKGNHQLSLYEVGKKNNDSVFSSMFKTNKENDLIEGIYVVLKRSKLVKAINNLPKISFKKINPTKYVAQVSGAVNPYLLVFSESFHSGWRAYIRKVSSPKSAIWETWFKKPLSEDRHFLVNGYANSWWVEKQGDYEIVLEFWPQRLLYIGLLISGLTFLCCVGYLVYAWGKGKKVKKLKK